MAPPFVLLPLASVRPTMVNKTFVFTVKSRMGMFVPPLMRMERLVSIKVVLFVITIVFATATVPVAANETVPPPARAARKEALDVFVTTPAQGAETGRANSPAETRRAAQLNPAVVK